MIVTVKEETSSGFLTPAGYARVERREFPKRVPHGLLIVFSGTPSEERSVQFFRLHAWLRRNRFSIRTFWEEIMLAFGKPSKKETSRLNGFFSAYGQCAREQILPALQDGKIVLCERHIADAYYAYAFPEGCSANEFRRCANPVTEFLHVPDITFWFSPQQTIFKDHEKVPPLDGFGDFFKNVGAEHAPIHVDGSGTERQCFARIRSAVIAKMIECYCRSRN